VAQVTQLPRPLLIGLIGAAVVLALFVATRQGGQETAGGGDTPAPAESANPAREQTRQGAGTKAGESQAARSQAGKGGSTASQTLPAPVKRALDADKVVVLLFWNARGSEDRAVKGAVDGISRRNGKVAVLTDTPRNVSRYTRVTGSEPVTQTPTVVVIDRGNNGRVASGYVDEASVEQLVVDALREQKR
jgi:hypothetical protein